MHRVEMFQHESSSKAINDWKPFKQIGHASVTPHDRIEFKENPMNH